LGYFKRSKKGAMAKGEGRPILGRSGLIEYEGSQERVKERQRPVIVLIRECLGAIGGRISTGDDCQSHFTKVMGLKRLVGRKGGRRKQTGCGKNRDGRRPEWTGHSSTRWVGERHSRQA